jgi:signal transduction histidine kinase/ligand-binding sensor domain-containing protein/CheY-like chemotaxis protein
MMVNGETMIIKKIITIILLLCICSNVKAEQNKFTVEEKFIPATTYSTKNGLSSNNIQDIIEDENGFLWLATQKGLSRFDSDKFKNFQKDKSNSHSLPNILVEELLLMPNGKVWMSINEVGITIFDQFNQHFNSIKNNSTELFNMPNRNLFGMAKDKNNNAWFSIYGEGIYQWDVQNNTFIKHLQSNDNAWLSSKKTFEILIDQQNRLWVCTIDSMVFMYDIDNKTSKSFNFAKDVNDPLSSPIYGFAESSSGDIYAGGYSGVFKFNEESGVFDSIIKEQLLTDIYGGEHTSVRRLMIDSNENLWVGTVRSLLQYSNSKLKKVTFYENGEVIKSDWSIHSMLEGYDGNIWIGTEGKGLIKLAPDWNRYNIYISTNEETINIRRAYQFNDTIWMAHLSSKMESFELFNGNLRLVESIYPDLGLGSIRIDNIYQEKAEFLWISSIQGIHKIDTKTGESQMVVNEQGDKLGNVRLVQKVNNQFYFHLLSEEKIGYFQESDMQANVIENEKKHQVKGTLVHQIQAGLNNDLWIATNHGIERLDFDNHQFTSLLEKPEKLGVDNFFIDGLDVWYIVDGSLYKAKWDGNSLVEQEDKFSNILPLIKLFEIKNLSNNIMTIASEDSGLIELDIETLKHNVYTMENGLPSDVIINVLFPDQIPMVFTEAGVATYNLDFEAKPQKKPKIVIDEIFHGETRISTENNENLQLPYNYGSINFDVALLSYTNASSIEYQYKLTGINEDWVHTGNDDSYTFLNLGSNNYTFNIRGRSNYGDWSDPATYSFNVESPPWKSIWAYLLYAMSAFALSYWLYYLYKRKILYEHEIIKQQTQKQIANEASKAKSDFLARVSHEVRTPLNGVLGMGELMLDTNMDDEQQIYAETIIASGQHLLEIINDILDLSKIEAGKLELENQKFDLLTLVDEVVLSFTSQTRQSNLLFVCFFDPNINRSRLGDIIRLKQILFNLLSNAFKFTKKGSIILEVSATKHDETLDFKVSDSGIGVDPNNTDELFKPFVQADPTVTRKYGGTGLGLAIVKQLVEKMNGFIEVDGAPGKGSIFHFQVKIETSTNKLETTLNSKHDSIALILNNVNLKKSLSNYLTILNQGFTNSISNNTSLIITNETALEFSSKKPIQTIFIGVDGDSFDKNTLKHYTPVSLPITFKKLRDICQGNHLVSAQPTKELYKSYCVSLKVLYVEDNVINQHVGIEMIEKMGHLIDVVDNVEEALTMLERNSYDLLLVDYHLPVVNGITLIEKWENTRNIPVLVITADLTDEVYQNCQRLDVKQIVSKPFSQIQLHEAIESAFDE